MNPAELLPSAIALFAAIYAGYCQFKVTRMTAELTEMSKQQESHARIQEVMKLYRVPLANAAYDLQSRLYNMVERSFHVTYYRMDARHSDYVIKNSMFLIAQYFTWTEIIRREVKHLDHGDAALNRQMAMLRDQVYATWQSTRIAKDDFHIFAGEQRAIGEQLIVMRGSTCDCMGYWDFVRYVEKTDDRHMLNLQKDVIAICEDPQFAAKPRLIQIQNALIDLIEFLDPEHQLFPAKNRGKLTPV